MVITYRIRYQVHIYETFDMSGVSVYIPFMGWVFSAIGHASVTLNFSLLEGFWLVNHKPQV